MTGADPQRTRNRLLAVGLVVVLVASAASWWLGTRVKSPAQAAAAAGPPPASPITAPVEYRRLEDVLVVRGTVRASREAEITVDEAPEGRRFLVTRTFFRQGDRVPEGALLVEVAGRPVFALGGAVPMYRDLYPGVQGGDVEQLQAALARLGFGAWGDRPGVFGAGTARAVSRFYRRHGYQPLTRAVPAGAGAGGIGSQAAPTGEIRDASAVMVPASEVAFVDGLPAQVIQVGAVVGKRPEGPLLRLATGRLVVEARLGTAEQQAVRPGAAVTMEAELAGLRFDGKVVEVTSAFPEQPAAPPARADDPSGADTEGSSQEGSGQQPGELTVRVQPTRPLNVALLGEDVRVSIRRSATRGKVLVVPLAAVWTGADGSLMVTRVLPGGRQERVRVEAGLSADGFVELRRVHGQLRPGDMVLVGWSGSAGEPDAR